MDINSLLQYVASGRGWPLVQDASGDHRMEVPTEPGRTQVVQVTRGADPEGRAMLWIWSVVADTSVVSDPWFLLKKNAELAYGALAVRGSQILLVETRGIDGADPMDLASAVFHVARAADGFEKLAYGAGVDQR